MTPTWHIKSFTELSKEELYAILRIRQDVFVVEQTCAYNDIDGNDDAWLHVFAKNGDAIVAYARLRLENERQEPIARIGRVLVAMQARHQGLARQLMQHCIEHIHTAAPNRVIQLSAQCYLLEFYNSLGFVEVGYEYLEDDIPHHDMEWRA